MTTLSRPSGQDRIQEADTLIAIEFGEGLRKLILSLALALLDLILFAFYLYQIMVAWGAWFTVLPPFVKVLAFLSAFIPFVVVGWKAFVLYLDARRSNLIEQEILSDRRLAREAELATTYAEVERIEAESRVKSAQAERLYAEADNLRLGRGIPSVLAYDANGNPPIVFDHRSTAFYQFQLGQYKPNVPANYKIEQIQEQKPALLSGPAQIPDPIDFAEILKTFTPSDQGIYIATGVKSPIITPMYDLTHVGMGGRTGGGKTNTTRLLMAQLLYAEASVYMATPSIAQVKYNGYRLEDWRPIIARLKEPPARDPEQIKRLLERFLALFEKRKREEDITPRRQKDVFLILGELPGITARLKKINYDGVEVIELLLREARQYGVHVITEFQDILVKTTGLDSGVRENLLTGIYYGGDPRTAKVLLHLEQGEKIEESGLGKHGASYVKVKAVKAQPARVPFFSNRALYQLLGEPPDPMPDREIYDEAEIPEFYQRIVDGRYVDACSNIEVERNEDDLEARPSDRKMEPLTRGEQLPETRSEIDGNPLVDDLGTTTEERPSYPIMDQIQSAQFLAGYRIKRDIDFNLGKLRLGSRYRQHARELIKQEGL